MQRYYVQYLSGFDAVALNQMISMLVTMSEDESVILASIQSTIAQLSVTQGDYINIACLSSCTNCGF
jgi:NCK-associated protein 1